MLKRLVTMAITGGMTLSIIFSLLPLFSAEAEPSSWSQTRTHMGRARYAEVSAGPAVESERSQAQWRDSVIYSKALKRVDFGPAATVASTSSPTNLESQLSWRELNAESLLISIRGRNTTAVQDEGRSVLQWFTVAQQAAARSGDLSFDMTAAIQAAVSSGESIINMHNFAYRIDGTINIPTAGVTIIGDGWSAQRGPRIVNNGGKMFAGTSLTGPLRLSGGTLFGNVVLRGRGYSTSAAGIYVLGGSEVDISNMQITGFASAAQLYKVSQITVRNGSNFYGNKLTGISGSANKIALVNSVFRNNGFSSSKGQSHDVYFINSADGTITGCYIGDPVDPASASLMLRYDRSASVTGFDALRDWKIYANAFVGGLGIRVGSDPGVPVAARKPPANIDVFNNVFKGGAGLRFDDPQNSRSWENKGMAILTVSVASSYPGYAVSYTSQSDECGAVESSALRSLRSAAREGIIFKAITIHNGANPAFSNISSFGGAFAATIVKPNVTGKGVLLDSDVHVQYIKGIDIVREGSA